MQRKQDATRRLPSFIFWHEHCNEMMDRRRSQRPMLPPPAKIITTTVISMMLISCATGRGGCCRAAASAFVPAAAKSNAPRQSQAATRLFGSSSSSSAPPGGGSTQKKKKTKKTVNHPRKLDKVSAEPSEATDGALSWETFDFSTNPKLDSRFSGGGGGGGEDNESQKLLNRIARGQDSAEDFAKVTKLEAIRDREAAKKMDEINAAYRSLTPELVASASAVLEPYINTDRVGRIDTALGQRTKRAKFLYENPSNPSNVWACLRTIDSFGVQNVDVIIDSGMYEGKMAISAKSGMRTAMGSAKWLTLRNHLSTADAVAAIKAQGYQIWATDLNPDSVDVRELDWDAAGPVCVVMGNEERGISDEMRRLVDKTFTLPMCGFAESFNLSVATSITLAHMSSRSDGQGNGPLRPGDLDEHELACLRLKGLLGSLPQRRMGKALLKQNGIILPEQIMSLL